MLHGPARSLIKSSHVDDTTTARVDERCGHIIFIIYKVFDCSNIQIYLLMYMYSVQIKLAEFLSKFLSWFLNFVPYKTKLNLKLKFILNGVCKGWCQSIISWERKAEQHAKIIGR